MIFKAKLLEKKQLTHKIVEVVFKLIEPKEINFIAGQFVMLEVGDVRRRPYSIVSLPGTKNQLTFCVDVSPDGAGSKYIKALVAGDEVELQGPLGVFTVKDHNHDLLFVATGAGVAPFLPMIADVLQKKFSHKATLLFGIRNEQDLFYTDYFNKLVADHSNFNFILALSQPKNEWHGYHGRITKYLAENYEPKESEMVYICGGPQVVKDVRNVLLEKGLNPLGIKFEVFS